MIAIATRPASSRALVPFVAAASACAGAGAVVALRPSAMPLVVFAGAVALLSLRWRGGVLLLVVTLPFAGVPALLVGTPGLLARDVLIVAPLYLGFGLYALRQPGGVLPSLGLAVPALLVLTMLALAYAPAAENARVGAIGVKVWLAYVPLLAVGYHFVRRIDDFATVLRLTALLGLIPAAIALAQFGFAVTGDDFGPLEGMYASRPLDETYRWVTFETSAGKLLIPRVPSTFTAATQYYNFALVAFACALGLAMHTRRAGWMVCAVALALAALASGARAAYLMVPALALLSLALGGVERGTALRFCALGGVAAIAMAIAGVPVASVAVELPSHIHQTLGTAWGEMRGSVGFWGHGTGWDTNAALRYGGGEQRYIENWYAKAGLELGLAGLVAAAAAMVSLVIALAWRLRGLDARTRALTAPAVALLAVVVVSLWKGPYIDLDPMNVYFWLLTGMVAGVTRVAIGRAATTDDGALAFGARSVRAERHTLRHEDPARHPGVER